ncbi:zeta toxin family protein [Nocardioides korecus]
MTWSSLEELEAATADYQANWWRSNEDALKIIEERTTHPGLHAEVRVISDRGELVSTARIYRPGAADDRPYVSERLAVHARIVADCVAPGAAGVTPATPAHADRPTVFFTIGCPGAGKTSVLRSIVDRHRTRLADAAGAGVPTPYSVIDADRVRQLLPEYAEGLGSLVVATECFDLTYGDVFDRALDRRADIVYDTIGRLGSMRDYVERLRSADYDIHLLHASAPLDRCQERTEHRALEVDGRLVPAGMLERWANDADETLAALLSEDFPLAGWAKVDTTDIAVPTLIEGTTPWSELW